MDCRALGCRSGFLIFFSGWNHIPTLVIYQQNAITICDIHQPSPMKNKKESRIEFSVRFLVDFFLIITGISGGKKEN